MIHDFIPDDCLITDIVPILKCKNKDAINVGYYRPIAVATTISKLIEHFILLHIKPFLSTSDHRFGFKRGTGTVLFNLCVIHGFIPDDCLITDIVPILKCKNKDAINVGYYRPIAVATTISKLNEHFILLHIKPFLSTSDHRFGFKRGTGTDMCIFLLKQIISSYLQQGSPIFLVFLDASKAGVSNLFEPRAILTHQKYWWAKQTKQPTFCPKIIVISKI